ncbi:MAG TPA: AbrB/MazE/SpoVT family DNA-binding domain-containing protein [Vicinamibacteria bacterium]|nr:AbrB/MazE/SpoVT family DNA-binding domain-containing protein [Vicinamibacteria bacterium]
MELVKLGKKGQLSIPKNVLKRLGIEGEALLILETTPDGAIRLRQAGVYPLEIYDEKRLKEFQEADRMSRKEAAKLKALIRK